MRLRPVASERERATLAWCFEHRRSVVHESCPVMQPTLVVPMNAIVRTHTAAGDERETISRMRGTSDPGTGGKRTRQLPFSLAIFLSAFLLFRFNCCRGRSFFRFSAVRRPCGPRAYWCFRCYFSPGTDTRTDSRLGSRFADRCSSITLF
jgi:hypothetical protein